jgi:hypothetical protein
MQHEEDYGEDQQKMNHAARNVKRNPGQEPNPGQDKKQHQEDQISEQTHPLCLPAAFGSLD